MGRGRGRNPPTLWRETEPVQRVRKRVQLRCHHTDCRLARSLGQHPVLHPAPARRVGLSGLGRIIQQLGCHRPELLYS